MSGTVTNPGGIVAGGHGDTILTRSATDTGRTDIVLDYGRDIGGIPSFTVAAAAGSPTMEAGYSEAGQYIAADGDGGVPSIGANGDPSRSDSYTVPGPGVITNRYIQGGQRYQEISLTSPGSVTLSAVGIRYTAYDGTPSTFKGYFLSSDATLNKEWYDGAYTLNLTQDAAGTQSGQWAIENGAMNLTARSGFIGSPTNDGVLKWGDGWRNYTSDFTADIISGQVSWSVRAQDDLDQYAVTLNSATAASSPGTVIITKVSHGVPTILGTFTTPLTVNENQAYQISTKVAGPTITVSVGGAVVGSVTDATFGTGTVGFGETGSGTANVSDLTVTTKDGQRLYASKLDSAAALADFETPGTPGVDVILDGAKRDRATFTGDLSVAAQTLYDTNDDTSYVKGSLELQGSTQLTSGYVSPFEEPGTPNTGGLIPGEISVPLGIYSLYFLSDVGDYYKYTGDKSFAAREWPTVQREMDWELAQANSDGLFVTTAADDLNWNIEAHPGVVTFYNALYYKTLVNAAQLAAALGHRAIAASYGQDAANVKAQINAQLYDPSTGAYDISTTDRGSVAQDANSAVILYGIAPASRQAGIVAAMTRALSTPAGDLSVSSPDPASSTQIISPFIGSSDVDARFLAGDTAGALQLLTDEWGPMTTGPDGGSTWEKLAADGTIEGGGTSLAHAWSSGPTSALTAYVLGVTPTSAGYATWQVAPQPGNLSWVEGAVPTPHGNLTVKWASSRTGFRIAIQTPDRTTGTVVLPAGPTRYSLTVNGRAIPVSPGQTVISMR
ncbi:MAG: alpha-L-rhamnosidase C-terminal domain-containing protein [Trebonia sp.]